MNCKYMNMLRVVRGNAFKLKIAVEAYTPSGRRIDSFALGEAVLKLDKNGTLTTKDYTILEGTTILVAFDGSESLGVYGFQMSGEYEGEAWRWANAEIFQIVETNAKANIPDGCVLLDDTYNMAMKIVLSGGDGVTFTPSVSEQGIISWTNDGGLPNPEPRNIRGPRGEQGPQGEVGPQGPRGQMGLRGQIGPKGDKGDKGDTGATPVLDVTASVDENVGNPMVVVESFGPAEHRTFDFQFKNLKGQKGETGATGPQGPQGQQGEPGNYTKPASGIPLSDLNGNVASGIVYDVTANNSGATFASLSALLSSGSLSTLIPTDVRKGGMQIRFVQSSDNNYVQFRYMPSDAATVATFTDAANWQGVDAEPTEESQNLVTSGGVWTWVLAMITTAINSVKSWADNLFAKKDGYYETLGAGTATNLKGQNIVNGEFVYRKSGGNDAVATGAAFIEGLQGNTLAINQLISKSMYAATQTTIKGVTLTNNGNGSVTINGTNDGTGSSVFQLSAQFPLYENHSYIIYGSKNMTGWGGYSIYLNASGFNVNVNSNGRQLFEVTGQDMRPALCITIWADVTVNMDRFYPMIFDLTLIYGAGNEPSTPEQFEADYFRLFGKPLTYEAYDAGSLRSVKMSALKTVGFNQWDEEWEAGEYSIINGTKQNDGTGVRAKNKIRILPDTIYYLQCNSRTSGNIGLCWYDLSGNFISGGVTASSSFTSPANAAYLTFFVPNSWYGSVYKNDICVNISNTNKNGTYEENWESEASVPVTTMTGKVNGQGESVVVFPDGMLSAGNVHDEIYKQGGKTYAIKRVGRVDLGSLTWAFDGVFYTLDVKDYKFGPNAYAKTEFICSRYTNGNGTSNNTASNMPDKSIRFYNSVPTITLRDIFLKDTSYTDAAVLTTALSGVYLNYELATPIIYELDEFPLPEQFMVDALGTEEIIPVSGELAVAPILALRYGVNAVGTIQNLPKGYISEGSMDDFLASLGSAMGGTWTKTWNATTNKYDFSFTPNA